jgi:hypothetical protein
MDSSKLKVKFQINTDTGTDDLGGATIVFDFDTTALSFPITPIKDIDYVFNNFSDGNYSSATITKPMNNKIWVNIDLPFISNNNGTVVASSPGWTDVVIINFDIVDPNGTASLSWLTTSPFWGIYDANNSTLWQSGVFVNLNGPLPVELVSFTGTFLPSQNVLLEWKTASAVNLYGFEVEKSYSNEISWETIGFVESYGDPSSLVEYSFTDLTAHSFPVVNNRLKSIDNDGSFQYSYIIELNTGPVSFDLSQNYPNPFNPSTKIIVKLPHTTKMVITVYNLLGGAIEEMANGEYNAGVYEFSFNANGLASGVYVYRIESTDFNSAKKMVLLR